MASKPLPAPHRALPRSALEVVFLVIVLLLIAGFSALLFTFGKNQEIQNLRVQLDSQQLLNERLQQQFNANARPAAGDDALQRQFERLLAEQSELRADMTALNSALATVMVERDQLRQALDDAQNRVAGVTAAPAAGGPVPGLHPAAHATQTPGGAATPQLAVALRGRSEPAAGDPAPVNTPPTAPGQPVVVAKGTPVLLNVPGKGLRLDEIHFSPSSSRLSPGAALKTRKAAELFLQRGENKLRLVGFSDTVGSSRANRRMAEKRADAVARLLLDAGVRRDQIEIVAKGEDGTPLRTGDGVDEPLNRCVGIFAVD